MIETPRSDSAAARPAIRWLLRILVIGLAALFAFLQLSKWPGRVRYPGELESVEGNVLAEMTLLRQGEPVYAPASPETFRSMIYGPLYYLLGSRLVHPQQPTYTRLRMLSLVATLALAGACGLLAWWITENPSAAALSLLMFLAYRFVTRYGVTARSDSVALLLWFSAFLAAYRFRDSNKIFWSIPLMTLGAYYKQQFIVAPLAVFLFLVLEKRYRTALQFAVLLGAAGLSLLAAFELLVFRHQAFHLHFLAYNLLPFSLSEGLLWRLLALLILFLIPSLMALRFLQLHSHNLLACYFGCAMVLLPVMASKQGSALNYGLELFLILCPLVASYLTIRRRTPERAAALICLLGVALWLGHLEGGKKFEPSPQDLAQEQAVQGFLRANFPPHTPALGYFTGDLLQAGLSTPITDLYQYSWLVCKGDFKEESFVAQIRRRRFGVILLNQDLTSENYVQDPVKPCLREPVRQAILHNYRLGKTFEFELWDKRPHYAWVRR